MAGIYNDLRSPCLPAKFSIACIPGMYSELYTYQKETIETMLAWELEPSSMNDPLYIPVTAIDGAIFYLQPEKMELLQECPQMVQTRGGILCEELGLHRSSSNEYGTDVHHRHREDDHDARSHSCDTQPASKSGRGDP